MYPNNFSLRTSSIFINPHLRNYNCISEGKWQQKLGDQVLTFILCCWHGQLIHFQWQLNCIWSHWLQIVENYRQWYCYHWKWGTLGTLPRTAHGRRGSWKEAGSGPGRRTAPNWPPLPLKELKLQRLLKASSFVTIACATLRLLKLKCLFFH